MVKDASVGGNGPGSHEESSDSEADSASPAAQRRVPGPRSCLYALAVGLVLGLGSIGLSKLIFDRRNRSVLEASDILRHELANAEAAPGAALLRERGCDAAGVLTRAALQNVAQKLEDETAASKRRPSERIDLGGDDTIVYCAKAGEAMPCTEVAQTYVGAAAPSAAFTVTSRTRAGETCSERFDTGGARLGPAPSPNLPMLLPAPP